MNWNELIQNIPGTRRGTDSNPIVTDICYDSRSVKPGAAFVAIPGYNISGTKFIDDAIKRGASAIVSEVDLTNLSVPSICVENIRAIPGELSKKLWSIDTNQFKTIGVTGTNGKTTTTFLVQEILKTWFGRDKAWMYSTIENHENGVSTVASLTTPQSNDIFRQISKGDTPKSIVMEVSSHALYLQRVAGLQFDVGVWTNLTQDHLDFHQTMDSYYAAKKSLFTQYLKQKGIGVINSDDEWGQRLCSEMANESITTYGISKSADIRILKKDSSLNGLSFSISLSESDVIDISCKVVGDYNTYNIAAAVGCARSIGVNNTCIEDTINNFSGVPGRLQRVGIDSPFTVIVDYAHTPDALLNVLKSLSKLTKERLFCLFGCGGDRDITKRPLMAKAVAYNCDEMIVTSDNPRTENPNKILEDIRNGIPMDFPHTLIKDRRKAIHECLLRARPGDCVLIAGKGHETYQEIHGKRHDFSDIEVTKEEWLKVSDSSARQGADV